jgi:hypothetical protein
MAIRDKLKTNASHLLDPGEPIQVVFPAKTMIPIGIASLYAIFGSIQRVVVVTDRRILVCKAGHFRPTQVKEIIFVLPRHMVIGPAHGLNYRTDSLGDDLYINRRFFKDVAAADAAIGSSPGE